MENTEESPSEDRTKTSQSLTPTSSSGSSRFSRAIKRRPLQALLFVLAFAIIGTTTLLLTHAASAIPSGLLTLDGGKWCLDNDHGIQTQANKIQLWSCNKSGPQVWDFYADHTVHYHSNSSYCLDVQHGGTTSGTPVWLWPCNNTAAQVWNISKNSNGTAALVNPQANKCLDNNTNTQVNGNKIQLWSCNGTSAQNWTIPTATVTTPAPAASVTLTASPTVVNAGQSATLTWSTSNAGSCTASGAWSGTKASSGSVSTGAINATATYTLSCSGNGSSTQASTTVSVASAGVGQGLYPADQLGVKSKTVQSLAQPGYLQRVTDATFGNYITRISDQTSFHTSSKLLTHTYAKVQVWNADDSMILLDGWDYDTGYLLDGSGHYLRTLHLPDGNHSARWSNVNPNNLYGIPDHAGQDNSGNQLVVMHPKTDMSTTPTQTVLHTFSQFDTNANMSFGLEEGNFSNDDSLGAVIGWSGSHKSWGIVTFHMTNTMTNTPTVTEIATKWLGAVGGTNNDPDAAGWNNISAMPKSDGIVIEWNGIGSGINQGIEWMNPAMTIQKHVADNTDHYDEALDANGNEMLVMSCGQPGGNSTNQCTGVSQAGGPPWLAAYGMNGSGPTGTNINLYPIGYPSLSESVHISCRNQIARPGWCYISDMTNDPSKPIGYQQIYAIKLDTTKTVEVFGADHGSYNSCDSCNQYAARAVPSQNGTKVIFASDWGKGTSSPSYDYLIQWP